MMTYPEILGVKKAAIVLKTLASGFDNPTVKAETMALVQCVMAAAVELEWQFHNKQVKQEIELGDVVQMQDNRVLNICMNDGGRLYGVIDWSNFPRFVPEEEMVFVSRNKVKHIYKRVWDNSTKESGK